MKIKQICIAVLLWLGLIPAVHAQSFDKLWKQVEQAQKKDLPKTVIQLTSEIFRKAEAEKNSPEMLKAYMMRGKYREMLTPDSFFVNLKGLEQWAQKATKPMDRAIIHSIIAGIYTDFVSNNRWSLMRQKEIVDEVPSTDIREWTGNMFVEKVRQETLEALKDSTLLFDTSARNYVPFVELGEASTYFHHDMYHLLASRGIDALEQMKGLNQNADNLLMKEVKSIYDHMESTYQKRGYKDAYILVVLDKLNWLRTDNPGFSPYRAPNGLIGLTQDPYLAELNKLISEYKSQEVCAEVYLAKARYAMNQNQKVTALQLCEDAIRSYPGYRRINELKNLKEEILSPMLNVQTDEVVYPNGEQKLVVIHKNLSGFKVEIYQAKKLLNRYHYLLNRSEDYQERDTTFVLKTPSIGKYVMRIIPDIPAQKNPDCEFSVTSFKVLTFRLPGDQYEIVTLDGKTGHPIPNANVTLYDGDKNVLQRLTTDAQGKSVISWNARVAYLVAKKGADVAMPEQSIYRGGFGYYGSDKPVTKMILLTDRSLYRPGQTVYLKGVVYSQQADSTNVLPGKEYTVTLKDVNNQEIAKKTVRTNDFGSYTTDFTLPAVCLNGNFRIVTDIGSTFIRVEDYKRPTFDITFNKQEGSYQLGSNLQVKGKVEAYSGVPLQGLPLKYIVRRSLSLWWRTMEDIQIASGEVKIGDDGTFSIPVSLTVNPEYNRTDNAIYRYTIEAIVTNVAGETQYSTDVITAGKRSLVLTTDLKERVRKDEPVRTMFTAQNLNGQPVAVDGTYSLYSIPYESTRTIPALTAMKPEGSPVKTGTFVSNKELSLDWKGVVSGSYLLVLSAKDTEGRDVNFQTDIVLFSTSDRRPPVKTELWYYSENADFDATHPGVFFIGTSEKDAYVMMNVYLKEKLLESKALNLSDSIVRFEYPYRSMYGEGLSFSFCMVKNQEVYQQQVTLRRRLPDKTLAMKWDVFRDKLRPGQKEEWKLTIHTPQGKPAVAEMLALMYDASLDKIWNRKQPFGVYYNLFVPTTQWMSGYNAFNFFNYWWKDKYLKVPELVYDRFWAYHKQNSIMLTECKSSEDVVIGAAEPRIKMRANVDYSVRGVAKQESSRVPISIADVKGNDLADVKAVNTGAGGEMLPAASTDLRTNFAETAFFYPQLRTNGQGEVAFSFTMPESLTRWNFRGYSHTKDMFTGMLDAEVTTSKEFMLTPNLPRFVRVGDKTSIPASIANLTGKLQEGTVSMILFDPITDKVISTQKQKFSVELGQTIGVNFTFNVTDKYDVLGCRMIADSGMFSDGEQQLLPVLSDKVSLTDAISMPVRGKGVWQFNLKSLFAGHSKTATDRRLTVEFTGNPAWYAIQALPSLSQPTTDNAISWASAYYANSLASYIMNSQPRIKAVFDSWKLQGGTKETFLSNLQKNQEVKNILLSESPWVMEAKTEEQQKERIATLFDLNNIRNNNVTALTKLKELQGTNGAWTWYKGMSGSRSVTTYIAELNARLSLLTGQKLEGDAFTMQQAAFKFLHSEALVEYQNILKAEKNGVKSVNLSGAALQYLYLIAISGEKVPASNLVAYNYFLSKVKGLLGSQSMETKAFAAIILEKAGQKQDAAAFIASLKEYLTKSDEQGMFFAFHENPYSLNGSQMVAHVAVMEAFETVQGNSSVTEEMKIWLLKQKQTQQWNSPVTTVNAVYALFMQGFNLLDNRGDAVIKIANEVLSTNVSGNNMVQGLGYVQQAFTQKNVLDARQITVDKQSEGIAWGAVYAQYEIPISDVRQQGNELNVKKQLYVERNVNNTPQLQPVTAGTLLKVGDKIVSRLTIQLDRPMDFIQLKDQSAACFEPVNSLSGYRWNSGIGYYIDVKDASTNFFFDSLGKGVYVLEYSYRISRSGTYEAGIATLQSAYAPEYASHSGSTKVVVSD